MDGSSREMDPMKAQQLAAELEVEMMADMYNRYEQAAISFTIRLRLWSSFVQKWAFKGNRKGHLFKGLKSFIITVLMWGSRMLQ